MSSIRSNICRADLLLSVFASLLGSAAIAADLPQPLKDTDFLYDGAPSDALVALGRELFFDPVLSGNQNISCGTCHDPLLGTSDGLALGIGEGGVGAGAARRTKDPVTGRVPRNSPALWNIGAREYRVMFHDGRLENFGDEVLNMRIPAVAPLPDGLQSLLAAQAFFPVTSAVEMAGQRGENAVADALLDQGFSAGWSEIAGRVATYDGYVAQMADVFTDVTGPNDIEYAHIAEALAAFQTAAFRADQSPFDQVLETGDDSHLPPLAQEGMALFYGEAGCSACHSGPLLTDHEFHAIGVPQIGPGKGHGRDPGYWEATGMMAFLEDEGRYRVTSEAEDLFAFRTPSLRNVAVTGPWGHSGAFDSLEAMVRHHLDAANSLESFDVEAVTLPKLDRVMDQVIVASSSSYLELESEAQDAFSMRDGFVQSDAGLRARIANANVLAKKDLEDADVARLVAFLDALTDPKVIDMKKVIPETVSSGLMPEPSASR